MHFCDSLFAGQSLPGWREWRGKKRTSQCTALDSILKHQGAVYFHCCTSRHCRHAIGKSACMPVISCLDRLVFWTMLKHRHFEFGLPGFCHSIFFSRHFSCAVGSEPDWELVAVGMDYVCGGVCSHTDLSWQLISFPAPGLEGAKHSFVRQMFYFCSYWIFQFSRCLPGQRLLKLLFNKSCPLNSPSLENSECVMRVGRSGNWTLRHSACLAGFIDQHALIYQDP